MGRPKVSIGVSNDNNEVSHQFAHKSAIKIFKARDRVEHKSSITLSAHFQVEYETKDYPFQD